MATINCDDASERASLLSDSSKYSHGTIDTEVGVTDVYPGGITSPIKEGRLSKRWISIYVMFFTMFIGAASFSIVISSLFPFLQELTYNRATTLQLGIVIAAYSVGQLVASPLFGFWSDKRPVREPLFFSLFLCIVTNILYSYTQAFPTSTAKLCVLIAARLLVGFSAGNGAIARSYVSSATTESERVGAFAGISASQALGFVIGPVLGLAFVPLRSNGFSAAPYFFFNMYTGPGFFSAVLAFVNILLLLFLFKESRLIRPGMMKLKPVDKSQAISINSLQFDKQKSMPLQYDRVGAYICCILFFAILFMFAVFETIIIPYSMDEFAWSKHQGVFYNNIMFGALSVVSVTSFISVKFIVKCIDERVLFVVGLIVSAFGYLVLIPMGNDRPEIGIEFIEGNMSSAFDNSSLIPLFPATIPVGCRYPKLSWCILLPKLTFYQYVFGMILLSYGYCSSSVLCYSLFSRILGPNPQGVMMGVLTATGSFARIVGPLMVTYLYDITGPQITFACIIALLAIAVLLLIGSSYRLVPYGTPRGCPKILVNRK